MSEPTFRKQVLDIFFGQSISVYSEDRELGAVTIALALMSNEVVPLRRLQRLSDLLGTRSICMRLKPDDFGLGLRIHKAVIIARGVRFPSSRSPRKRGRRVARHTPA